MKRQSFINIPSISIVINVTKRAATEAIKRYEIFYPNPAGGSFNGNNTLDAYRHTYWNALMTSEISEDFAKDFSEAHEYGPLKKGIGNKKETNLAVDMDLLNNKAGRTIGNWWIRNGQGFMAQRINYPEIPNDKWEALGYYNLHCVAYGFDPYYNIYTFASDSKINEFNNPINNNGIFDGLVNTNFGERENLDGSRKAIRPYFWYPAYC